MANLKVPDVGDEKCKPTPPFSRPWMASFVADALATADLPKSLERATLGWGDYLRFRREDPAFGLACLEIDWVVRSAMILVLEARAAVGDIRAIKLLSSGLEEIRRMLAEARGSRPRA